MIIKNILAVIVTSIKQSIKIRNLNTVLNMIPLTLRAEGSYLTAAVGDGS